MSTQEKQKQGETVEKKILFMGSGSPFMKNAVTKNLKEAGYEIVEAEPDIEAIGECENEVDIIVLYFGSGLFEDKIMVYLKDLVIEKELLLFIIGDHPEINECREIFPKGTVTEDFEKPLDIRKFVDRMDRMARSAQYQKRKLLLLVDDDTDYLKMVSGWLEKRYRVVVVSSGMQAIKFLANNRPDLILLDYAMPVTDGPQVLEMIKSEQETDAIPVIFLTGKGDQESVMKVVDLKPDGYLLKSIGKKALLEELEKFFAKE